jgi:hypothetical protein
LAPTKRGDLVVFGEYGFLCDESKQDLIGSGLHRIYGSDEVEDISRQKKNATNRELTGGVLSQPGILEHSTKGMISKHEESSLVLITLAYKMTALTPPILNLSACTHRRGTGIIVWNGESGDQDWDEMLITLRGHFAVYLKALNIFMFLYKSCL